MTILEYFKDWYNLIDTTKLINILNTLNKGNIHSLCPKYQDIFKAFELCSYNDLSIVMIGQDLYPQKGMATGILFGNSKDTPDDKLSPSLQVIKESVINFEVPHNFITFDPSLESWAKQGILMLNSALTCEIGKPGSHVNIWRPFIVQLLKNLSESKPGLIYVLFGNQAGSFKPYINKKYNDIVEIEHPAYFARINKPMPHNVFNNIDIIYKRKYGTTIEWYKEESINSNINNNEYGRTANESFF